MTIPTTMAKQQSSAWILRIGDNRRVAVGRRELLHITDAGEIFDVPQAPWHCRQVVLWRNSFLPLMDLALRFGESTSQVSRKLVAILGYQNARGEAPQFGALWLAAPPSQVLVLDEQACLLPSADASSRDFAFSCFDDGHGAIPILNVARIFS